MNTEEITKLTLDAWEEVQQADEQRAEAVEEEIAEVEAEVVEEQPEEEAAEEETSAEPSEEEAGEEADAAEEESEPEQEEEAEQLEEEVTAAFASDNPQVQAYLAKYQGDPEKALVAAVHLQQALGRQGQEKAVLTRRVAELEQEIAQAQSYSPGILTPEQRQWAEQAVQSDRPGAYVQEAVRAGEFALARAVCDGWAEESPYEAARAAQSVDAIEWQARAEQVQQQQQEEVIPFDQGTLMEVLVEHFPEMPQYEQQMVGTLESLGSTHPLVEDARSLDPETAARGIIGIYEIARAQSATVKTTRAKVQRDSREAADDARKRAVVTSAQTTAAKPSETPRRKEIMPGLTLGELDEAMSST